MENKLAFKNDFCLYIHIMNNQEKNNNRFTTMGHTFSANKHEKRRALWL